MKDGNELKQRLIGSIKSISKNVIRNVIRILLPIIMLLIIFVSSVYYIYVFVDGKGSDDWGGTPYAANQYTNTSSISGDGTISSGYTAQEIWDKNKEEGGRASLYLDNADQLAKLMNAELVTQYLDTRENPDEEIDWEKVNKADSKEVQGIIKLKRADSDGNTNTMTYVDQETFEEYIDKYNSSGSESDKKAALSHFTLENASLSSGASGSASGGQAKEIEEGTTINIKSGLGSIHTYMGWQKITSTTSTQYKLREKAGMNFDEEGFGKINGRYVIACTTTFGKVGDYIDFYQEDGVVINCIIGDIKSRGDKGCTKWGHDNGHCIIEFVVDKSSWYNRNHPNPGTSGCHPEWNKNLTKAVNGGNYFKKPDFGAESVTESGKTVENNDEENEDAMKWPTDGTTISSEYGPRNSPTAGASSNHKGVDISVPEGTNVYACEDGKVTIATNSKSAGNYIAIDHGNGYVSKYMHNSQLKVKVGDKVKRGDVIALSGNTGISTGAHLHFQIECDGKPVDPMTFKYDNGNGSGDSGVGSDSDNIEAGTNNYYAKVATWSETTDTVESSDPEVEGSSTTTYNMTTTNINYQSVVSKYKMPFDYLWALLVIGEDKDFVMQLADLVYGSQIEITVHDNLTTTTDTKVDTYTKKTKTDTEGQVTVTYDDQNGAGQNDTQKGNWSDEKEQNYNVTTININKDNTLDIALTKANVWIVDYSQEYTYKKPEKNTTENEDKKADEEYKDKPNKTSEEDEYGHVNQLLQDTVDKHTTTTNSEENTASSTTTEEGQENTEVSVVTEQKVDYIKTEIYDKKINRVINTTNEVETNKYTSSPGKVKEKTDKDAKEDNFVTILLKPECLKAKKYILEVSSWLFEILENNSKTSDMVDLTKYLLYKTTGKSYGVKKYDFSTYEDTDFSNYNETSTNNNSDDYVVETSASNSAPVVKDKEKFKKGLRKWLKTNKNQKNNALSIVDTVLECQEKDNVNAVFVYAFLRKESGIGTADTKWVNNDINWGSWNLGQKFSSPEENVKTITKNIKSGEYYFTQGNNTVKKIGAKYCPNTPENPTQGDEWIKVVNEFMSGLYSCMDISVQSSSDSTSVAKGGKGTIGVYTSSTGRKYNLYLQGRPAPWAGEDYGDSRSMALAGCGPTAEAIIASSYNADITPSTTRKDIVDKLGTGNHSSANWIGQSLKRLIPGIKTKVSNFNENEIKKCIKNSGQVWLVVQHCPYTSNAHCIALIDYKDSNQVYVAHGTAKSRKHGWDSLKNIKSYLKTNPILYVGGK